MQRWLFAFAAWLVAAAATAGPVTGTLAVKTRPGTTAAPAVVYAEPLDAAAPRRPGSFTLTQKGRAFQPSVLAVPVGSTVSFPNQDLVFHNVFSLSAPEPFDLGLYKKGESKSRTFTRPGLYRVFCNIHPTMTAFVAVVPTPWVAIADARGQWALDLPPRSRTTRGSPTLVRSAGSPSRASPRSVRGSRAATMRRSTSAAPLARAGPCALSSAYTLSIGLRA